MAQLSDANIGVCSWSLKPTSTDDLLASMEVLGLDMVQLALDPLGSEPAWSDAGQRLAESGILIASGMMGCLGEDYTSLETIHKTGGLLPDEHWHRNSVNAQTTAERAARMKIPRVSFHAGFISPDTAHPDFAKLLDRVRSVSSVFANVGVTLLLESGQESAATLETFLKTLNQPNVGVNFDPANILLYNMGDPIESLKRLLPYVKQVHIKDAVRTTTPGLWGQEVPAGEGQVDWDAFFPILREGGFTGNLMIEREAGPSRIADIQQAIMMVRKHLSS